MVQNIDVVTTTDH